MTATRGRTASVVKKIISKLKLRSSNEKTKISASIRTNYYYTRAFKLASITAVVCPETLNNKASRYTRPAG